MLPKIESIIVPLIKWTINLLFLSLLALQKTNNQSFPLLCILNMINDISSSYYYRPCKILLDKSDNLRKFLHCKFHILNDISSSYCYHPYNILKDKSDSLRKFLRCMFHMLNHIVYNNRYVK